MQQTKTENWTMRSSVTADVTAARFKSQMICSNQNKSHLVIFSARFMMLVFVICSSERERHSKGAWLLSFNGPSPFGNHCSRFAPAASVSVFPYGRTRWKASFYVAHKPPAPTSIQSNLHMSQDELND